MYNLFEKTSLIAALVIIAVGLSSSVSALPSAYIGNNQDVETVNNQPKGNNPEYSSGMGQADFYLTTPSDDYQDTAPMSSVPEPATIALLAIGLTALGLHRRRQRKSSD